jgi:predicted Ser/Thr protein kinase
MGPDHRLFEKPVMPESELKDIIGPLLKESRIQGKVRSIAPCAKGGNNRLYKITIDNDTYAIKQYFKSSGDIRDRLGSEFNFLSYAQTVIPDMVPKAYGRDTSNGLAVYEFLQGNPFSPDTVGKKQVNDAAVFFCALNQPDHRNSCLARSLPYSAEACFSIQSHLDIVSGRLNRLMEMPQGCVEDRNAYEFVERLLVFWNDIVRSIKKSIGTAALDQELAQDARCVSPSDFGFHNALSGENGKIWFIDFEYAGWDDPSRMVADFFSQLAVPIPVRYFDDFTSYVMSVFPESARLIERAALLLPVYRIKWCCIALNVFLPKHLERRLFANPELNEQRVKAEQLTKAEAILESVPKKG